MELVERVERAEAELMWTLASVPGAVRETLGISGQRFGAGMAIALPNDPTSTGRRRTGWGSTGR